MGSMMGCHGVPGIARRGARQSQYTAIGYMRSHRVHMAHWSSDASEGLAYPLRPGPGAWDACYRCLCTEQGLHA
jgi:hypothetical protein